MRKITIDGRLGKDVEIKTTAKGVRYARFSVANDIYSGGEVKTDWFDVVSFDQVLIDKRAKMLERGRYVIVTGDLDVRVKPTPEKVYTNLSIVADNIETPNFGSKKQEEGQNGQQGAQGSYSPQAAPSMGTLPPPPAGMNGPQGAPANFPGGGYYQQQGQPAQQYQAHQPQQAPQPQYQSPQPQYQAPQPQQTPQPQYQAPQQNDFAGAQNSFWKDQGPAQGASGDDDLPF